MAGNIDSGAGFTSSNMKPANSEVAASLWGRNIADNTGYLFYREKIVTSFSGTRVLLVDPASNPQSFSAEFLGGFIKESDHNTITGSCSIIQVVDDASINAENVFRIFDKDGAEVGTMAHRTYEDLARAFGTDVENFSWSYDASSLTDGEQYWFDMSGTMSGVGGSERLEIKIPFLTVYTSV